MKKMILALSILAITSCSKPTEKATLDANRQYEMKYKNGDQIVKTLVRNDTLWLHFNENVVVLVDPNDYANTWGMALTQEFSNSYLKDLHYFGLATPAGYFYDWMPINLNDAAPGQITSTNVTVDGKKYVQITISRLFEFFQKMGTPQAATDQQNIVLQRSNDNVLYKIFYSANGIFSLSNDATFKIVYTK
jgi:hypothetical protein